MNEKTPQENNRRNLPPLLDTVEKEGMSRRELLVLGALGSAALVGGLEVGRRILTGDSSEKLEDTEVDVSLGRAEELRILAETEGPDALIEHFQIAKEGNISDFSNALGGRLQDWIMAGCTPEEASSYTVDTIADYQAEMSDKYSIPAILALGGNAAVSEAGDGDPTSSSFYQLIEEAHGQMLEHYMKYMTEEAESPEITVSVKSEMGTPDPYNNFFPFVVDVEYVIYGKESGPLTISGQLNIIAHTASDMYEITLDKTKPSEPLLFARG